MKRSPKTSPPQNNDWIQEWRDKASNVYVAPDGSSALVAFIVHNAPTARYYYCATSKGLLKTTKFSCLHNADNIHYDEATKTWSATTQGGHRKLTISVEAETVRVSFS